jgi:hypothetical protein
MKRFKQSPGAIIGVIALVFALTGSAVAGLPKGGLKLGYFKDDSRDRLAGTGVIQYAAAAHVTPTGVTDFNTVHRFEVKCELSKKATSGGFKWTGTPPDAGDWQLVDAYPNGSGFVVRIQIAPAMTAENKPLAVYSNCVKSRVQRGTPPA